MAQAQEKVKKIISERQRVLQSVDFLESSLLTRELNKDTIVKFIQLRLSGAIAPTFSAGTPVAVAESTFDALVSSIQVTVNGSRTVKAVKPHLMAMQQLFATAQSNERKSVANATNDNLLNPTTDAGLTYGTTGQVVSFAESILIAFENIMAKSGKESTWLNLKGVASAVITFNTKAFTSLTRVTGITWTSNNQTVPVKIGIVTIEAQDVEASAYFSDFKQTTKEETFTGQSFSRLIDINRGNFLQGIMLFAQGGEAVSGSSNGAIASNLLIDRLALKINGQTAIKETNFLQLQAENRNKFGLIAPYSGGVSRIDGVAYLDMLRDGDVTTALDCRPPLVDQVQLDLDSRADWGATGHYSQSAKLTIMTNEIVAPVL